MFSFSDLLRGSETPAILAENGVVTRSKIASRSSAAADNLAQMGFRRGDTLAIWMPDGADWLTLLFAAARLGILLIPVSTRFRTYELLHILRTAGAKGIVFDSHFLNIPFAQMIEEARPDLPLLEHVIDIQARDDLCKPTSISYVLTSDEGRPDDPLSTFSTSGTTGNPKLAVHDQESIARFSKKVAKEFAIGQSDVVLCTLPLYGVLGFNIALAALAGGATCIFHPIFDPEHAAAAIDTHLVTHCFGSDTMLEAILKLPGYNLTSWRHGGFGDFNGRTRLVNFAEQRSGLRLVGAYGSSECFALMAKQVVSDPADVRSECGGAPVSSDILFRVVDVGSGSGVADGETGELQVKGFNVMTGYLNNPAATKEAFTADGWYRTGDLARLKGNKFAFLARISQSLRLSGYLVDPREIEEYLLLNKDVLDAAVVGARDQNGGEVAVAFVRTRTAEVTEESLKSLCRGRIAPYKVPACIVSMEELPFLVGPNGRKLDKRLLSELAKSLMASGEQRTRDSNSASLRTAKD